MTQYHPNGLHDTTETPAREPGMADRARERLDDSVAQAREATAAARDQARDTMMRGTEEGARFVRENPGAALAGALGIGVLIGLALGAGRR